jgi:hypothetical protein
MSDEIEKQQVIPATQADPKPTRDEEKLNRAAKLLRNLQQGWKVSVHRTAPSWARSHLETFDVMDESEPIDIDYLIKRWGGQCLVVAIHDEKGHWVSKAPIPAYSFPPKVYGQPITEAEVMGFGSPAAPPMHQNQSIERYHPQPQQPAGGALGGLLGGMSLPELLKMMQNSNKAESTLLIKLFERQLMANQQMLTQPQPAQAQSNPSPMKMMRDMMEMQMMMREMSENMGFGAGGGDDSPLGSLAPLLSTMAQKFMDRPAGPRQTRRNRPARPPARQPARVVPPPPPQQYVNTQPEVLEQNPQQFGNMDQGEPAPTNLRKLSDSLCDLSAEDSADVVLSAFDNMPAEKRERAMQAFFTKMQGEDVDELTESGDLYNQDVYPTEYDQTQEMANPYDHASVPGGPVRTAEGDDPTNRSGD